MSAILTAMIVISTLWAALNGRAEAVGAAAFSGAGAAVELCLTIGGAVCLWSGVLEVMERSGLSAGLSRLMRPALRKIFPYSSADKITMDAISANISANMLGLGNAATPMGIRAAARMAKYTTNGEASDELCRFVVLNTASFQLLPTTVAAIRATAGAKAAFDILPAVWISSLASVSIGLLCAILMEKLCQQRLR